MSSPKSWKHHLELKRIHGDYTINLIPFEAEHVPLYFRWMQSKELLEMTATEPMTIEDIEESQRRLLNDKTALSLLIQVSKNNVSSIIGDVNLFRHDFLCEDDLIVAEVDVMIAEANWRRKGIASEVVQMLLNMRDPRHLPKVNKFIVKILEKNRPSIAMFTKLGFSPIGDGVNTFGEYEMEYCM